MYKKKTIFFGIPIPCKGDKIQEVEETRARNIIENQLLAGVKGLRCAVFEEGVYRLIDHLDGNYSVSLSPNGQIYAFCGIIGGGYAESKQNMVWTGMQNGSKYWLYFQFTDSLYENETDFRLVIATTEKPLTDGLYLLMASVDLRNGSKELSTEPQGKVYSSDLASHTTDKTNPHGSELIQDNLIVRKRIKVDIDPDDSFTESAIVVDDKRDNKPVLESKNELVLKDKRTSVTLSDESNKEFKTINKTVIGAVNEVLGNKINFLEIDSPGRGGLLLNISDATSINFVNANQLSLNLETLTANLGNIVIGYFNLDNSVPNKNGFKLYNTGEVGIRLRLQVSYN